MAKFSARFEGNGKSFFRGMLVRTPSKAGKILYKLHL